MFTDYVFPVHCKWFHPKISSKKHLSSCNALGPQCGKARNSPSPKKNSWNQLFNNFYSKNVALLSRNFCQHILRVNFCNFHTVWSWLLFHYHEYGIHPITHKKVFSFFLLPTDNEISRISYSAYCFFSTVASHHNPKQLFFKKSIFNNFWHQQIVQNDNLLL